MEVQEQNDNGGEGEKRERRGILVGCGEPVLHLNIRWSVQLYINVQHQPRSLIVSACAFL